MQTHRQIAKRKTAMWQAAAVVVLLGAGAAIALPGVRNFLAPGPPPVKVTFPAGPIVRPVTDSKPIIIADSAESLKNHSSWVEPPPIPLPQNPQETVATAAPTPPPPATDWVYQGSMITSESRSALVKVDNNQEILSLGSSLNDAKLVTVEPDFIEIERAGVKKKIDRAPRTMVMPNEAPRKPVAFRAPPAIAGAPGAMPGGAMAMGNAAHPSATPPPPATFDQARMAQIQAAREAAARVAAGQNPPPIPPPESTAFEINGQKVDPGQRDEAVKYLSEPDLNPEVRGKYLQLLGITPGMPVDNAMMIAKKMGIDLSTDLGRNAMEAIQQNSKAESKEGK